MVKLFKNMDHGLLFVTVLLFGFGLVMIFSASNIVSFMRMDRVPYYFLERQAIFLAVGTVLGGIVLTISTKSYRWLSRLAIVFAIGLLVYTHFFGRVVNDARSWIYIGNASFQPSEIAKVIMIIWVACFYEYRRKSTNIFSSGLFPLAIVGIIFGLIFMEPDLGTGLIVLFIAGFIYIITPLDSTLKYKTLAIGVLFMILGAILYTKGDLTALFNERQKSRGDYDNPCSEEKFYTSGNQLCNGYIAMNNGNLTGKGLGKSTQKYLYLPESHTDYIFAIIVEELGYLTALFILFLYVVLLARIINIGRRALTDRNAIICYGVAFYIFLHIAINLCGISGITPMTGVPLPFLSYGGTFAICLIIALAVVQRINIETRLSFEHVSRVKRKSKR